MKFNGIMLDCCRLMEKHDYYFNVIDFMADWGMNTLLLHFSDNHGLAVELPGFEHLAIKNSFTAKEIKLLIIHAEQRGIDIIPELETFGHTRFMTDNPAYSHLLADQGDDNHEYEFIAIDPLNPETIELMEQLISATADLFDSKFLHIGCDEVWLGGYCKRLELDTDKTWADYVNKMGALVRKYDKTPMIWGDHPGKSKKIAEYLDKSLWVCDWHYLASMDDAYGENLKRAGFTNIITSPSLHSCFRRFIVQEHALQNTRNMLKSGQSYNTQGIINTIWCPWRYLQDAIYYGIAYSAWLVNGGLADDIYAFHQEFSERTLKTPLSPALHQFLIHTAALDMQFTIFQKLLSQSSDFNSEELEDIMRVNQVGRQFVTTAVLKVNAGQDIISSIALGAKALWAISEYAVILIENIQDQKRIKDCQQLLSQVVNGIEQAWDRTRFADDPCKYKHHQAETSIASFILPYIKALNENLKTIHYQAYK